ncbi:MAG: hypothetical protein L6Q57_09795 [Alphaproteobacteria bacterium]|nr:hypothetical protein [Alphaproteobacteria bacterium]
MQFLSHLFDAKLVSVPSDQVYSVFFTEAELEAIFSNGWDYRICRGNGKVPVIDISKRGFNPRDLDPITSYVGSASTKNTAIIAHARRGAQLSAQAGLTGKSGGGSDGTMGIFIEEPVLQNLAGNPVRHIGYRTPVVSDREGNPAEVFSRNNVIYSINPEEGTYVALNERVIVYTRAKYSSRLNDVIDGDYLEVYGGGLGTCDELFSVIYHNLICSIARDVGKSSGIIPGNDKIIPCGIMNTPLQLSQGVMGFADILLAQLDPRVIDVAQIRAFDTPEALFAAKMDYFARTFPHWARSLKVRRAVPEVAVA